MDLEKFEQLVKGILPINYDKTCGKERLFCNCNEESTNKIIDSVRKCIQSETPIRDLLSLGKVLSFHEVYTIESLFYSVMKELLSNRNEDLYDSDGVHMYTWMTVLSNHDSFQKAFNESGIAIHEINDRNKNKIKDLFKMNLGNRFDRNDEEYFFSGERWYLIAILISVDVDMYELYDDSPKVCKWTLEQIYPKYIKMKEQLEEIRKLL